MVHSIILMTTTARQSDPFLWYVTRMMAVGAYCALTLSVGLGMLRSIARTSGERLSWIVDELHQFISLLAGVLVAGHLLSLLFDPYLTFSLANLALPVNEPYQPIAVDLGVFALYGMVALLLTSWLRGKLSYGLWRSIHYLSFVVYGLVTVHGWLAGSDSVTTWMPALYAGSGLAIAFLVAMRWLFSERATSQAQPSALPTRVTIALAGAVLLGVLGAALIMVLSHRTIPGGGQGSALSSLGPPSYLSELLASQPHLPYL